MKRIGIMFGMENTFPPALVDHINGMDAELRAEPVKVGATRIDLPSGYDLIIDRVSHVIPYYRPYLKNAALRGTIVVNDPFRMSADDKFFTYCRAANAGVAIPKTMALPSKSHPPGATAPSMRNLEYPLPWKEIFSHIGFPAFLKPLRGGDPKMVSQVYNETEFFAAYDQTGDRVMLLQQAIVFDDYVRCYCVGQKNVRIMRYDPRQPQDHRYIGGEPALDDGAREKILDACGTLAPILGYDINVLEFAIRGGIPYAIDLLNPVPDADYYSIGAENFSWFIDAVSALAEEKLKPAAPKKKPVARPGKRKTP